MAGFSSSAATVTHDALTLAAAVFLLGAVAFAMRMAGIAFFGSVSGWSALQTRFPRGDEPALLMLRFQSGALGWKRMRLNGILELGACRSGIHVGVWRLCRPFQRPFLVPWNEIEVEPHFEGIGLQARIELGRPRMNTLIVSARAWQRLAQTAQHAPTGGPTPEPSTIAIGKLALRWLVLTMVMATALYFALLYAMPHRLRELGENAVTALVAITAVPMGIAALSRYIRQDY